MDSEVILRNKFPKRQKIRYRSVTEVLNKAYEKEKHVGTQNAKWEVEIVQSIIELEDDITAHILYYSTPVSIPKDAQMIGVVNRKQVIYVLMDIYGRVIDSSGIGFQGIVTFPAEAACIGDTWSDKTYLEIPGLPQTTEHTRNFTFKAVEKINEHDCAVISISSSESDIEVPGPDLMSKIYYTVKTSGEVYFDYKRGFPVKTTTETVFSSKHGHTIIEGSNRFTQNLIEVIPKV